MIVLMGSGELTATMVEVHKELLRPLAAAPKAVFLDTPAGFQLNADQIGENAVGYFKQRVGCPLQIVPCRTGNGERPDFLRADPDAAGAGFDRGPGGHRASRAMRSRAAIGGPA